VLRMVTKLFNRSLLFN